MSKQVTAAELAELVKRLLTDPSGVGELESTESFQEFMTDVAQVVCDHCGGTIQNPAAAVQGCWLVGIHGNDSLPEGGGVWREFDPEGELFDPVGSCFQCGTETDVLIGAPSGEEVCQSCFNQGAC